MTPLVAAPPNVVRRNQPSRTALAVATLRAAHQLLDTPLVLDDPLALPLLGADMAASLRADPRAFDDPLSRGLRAAVVARSRFVEDTLAACVAAGVRQYVVLGAGLDTYACRNPFEADGLRVFEVDHPGTQGWKRRLLAEAGIAEPPSLAFVPLDFESDAIVPALRAAGVRLDEPACVGWMGVTMYLSADAVFRTLADLAAFAPGSRVCLDYRVPDGMLDAIDAFALAGLAARAAAVGEPWRSSFDPAALESRLLDLGYASALSVSAKELNPRYFARRADGLRVGGSARIMSAIR